MKLKMHHMLKSSHAKVIHFSVLFEDQYGIISEELRLKGLNGTEEEDGKDNPLKQTD